jgi:phospholipase/carboxylesterase
VKYKKHARWLLPMALVAALAVGLYLRGSFGYPRLEIIRTTAKGPPTVMLLHGYGSSAEQWLPYTHTIAVPPSGRFLFPQGPMLIGRNDALALGHAWWRLDLASHRRKEQPGVDLRSIPMQGLARAARLVEVALDDEGNSVRHPFVLGGFSQGAMVSCEVAFASDEPLFALLILSGTPIDSADWRSGMAKRRGLPVFMSHGRQDDVLPYDLAELLHEDLVRAGLEVTFVPFDGGHEIPAGVVEALNAFLAHLKK